MIWQLALKPKTNILRVKILERDIVEIVTRIWECYANSTVQQTEPSSVGSIKVDAVKYASSIQITGKENFYVCVCMDAEVAGKFMMKMTGMDESMVGNEERQIMANELSNLVAGNVKAILRGSEKLHLPEISDANNKVITELHPNLMHFVEFADEFGFFQVAVFSQS